MGSVLDQSSRPKNRSAASATASGSESMTSSGFLFIRKTFSALNQLKSGQPRAGSGTC